LELHWPTEKIMTYDILWKIHAALMSTSFIALLCGIIISILYKRSKWRYKAHKILGIYAGLSGAAALAAAVILVQNFSGSHFSSLHTITGGVTGLLLLLTPVAGLKIRTIKNKKRLRVIHRITGYSTAVMMAAVILMGLRLAGVIGY